MKAKTKLKKNCSTYNRINIINGEANSGREPADLTQLRKPVETNVTSLKQVVQLLKDGTNEIKAILTYECQIIYECRVCRSLFRSLANLISHKRIYCLQNFATNFEKPSTSLLEKSYEINCVNDKEKRDAESKENCGKERTLRSKSVGSPAKRDLTSIIEKLQSDRAARDINCAESNSTEGRSNVSDNRRRCIFNDNRTVVLEVISTNKAAYQTVVEPRSLSNRESDLMGNQALELKDMLSRNTAVLGPDGQLLKLKKLDKAKVCKSVGERSDKAEAEEEEGKEKDDNEGGNDVDLSLDSNSVSQADLTCSMCNAQFSTKKTLTFHVKSKHTLQRMCYTCPCCTSSFTNSWSVYRHLFKVHRKTHEQVRKLRSLIQTRALKKDSTRFDKTGKESIGKKAIESFNEEANGSGVQEFFENLELDTELQRCSACGKRFDRKAALVSHIQICQRRINGIRWEIGGREKRTKYPKVKSGIIDSGVRNLTTTKEKDKSWIGNDRENNGIPLTHQVFEVFPISAENSENTEINIRVAEVSSMSKDAWDSIGTNQSSLAPIDQEIVDQQPNLIPLTSASTNSFVNADQQDEFVGRTDKSCSSTLNTDFSDVPEVIYTSIENSRPVTLTGLGSEKKLGIQYRGIRLPTVTLEKIPAPRVQPDLLEADVVPKDLPTVGAPEIIDCIEGATQFETKIAAITNQKKLRCLPCNRTFSSLINLRRHVAVHLRWNRYRCQICDYKSFMKSDCIAHCNSKHDVKNNRNVLAEMIVEMKTEKGKEEVYSAGKAFDKNDREIEDLQVLEAPEESTETLITKEACPEVSDKITNENSEFFEKPVSIDKEATVKLPTASRRSRGRPKSKKRVTAKHQWLKRNIQERKSDALSVRVTDGAPKVDEIVGEKTTVTNKSEIISEKLTAMNKSEIISGKIEIISGKTEIISGKTEIISEKSKTPDRSVDKEVTNENSSGIRDAKISPRFETDPDLRRMVMEVIFGSSDAGDGNQPKENGLLTDEVVNAEKTDTDDVPIQERLDKLIATTKKSRKPKKRSFNYAIFDEESSSRLPEKMAKKMSGFEEKSRINVGTVGKEGIPIADNSEIDGNCSTDDRSKRFADSRLNEVFEYENSNEESNDTTESLKIKNFAKESNFTKTKIVGNNDNNCPYNLNKASIREDIILIDTSEKSVPTKPFNTIKLLKAEIQTPCKMNFPNNLNIAPEILSPHAGKLIIYEDNDITQKLAEIQKAEIVVCPKK